MVILHIILPVLIGSLIGYCTNYLAIKMLFHPYNAVYIGKWKLPFTPGIIPKNQSRVANSLGDAVSEQLLTKETVTASFRKDHAGRKMIEELVSSVFSSKQSVSEWLPEGDTQEELINTFSGYISRSIMEKAEQIELKPVIARIGEDTLEPLLESKPLLAMFVNDSLKNAVYERLGEKAEEYLEQNGEETLKKFTEDYLREMGEKPLRDMFRSPEEREKTEALLSDLIEHAALRYSDTLLDQVDIREITRQRIEEMKVEEVEHLVLSVMKKELQAVINLGALIGAVIGIFNVFI